MPSTQQWLHEADIPPTATLTPPRGPLAVTTATPAPDDYVTTSSDEGAEPTPTHTQPLATPSPAHDQSSRRLRIASPQALHPPPPAPLAPPAFMRTEPDPPPPPSPPPHGDMHTDGATDDDSTPAARDPQDLGDDAEPTPKRTPPNALPLPAYDQSPWRTQSRHRRWLTHRLRHDPPLLPSCAQSQTRRTLHRLRPRTQC